MPERRLLAPGMPPEARTNTGQRPFLNNFQPSKDANDQETRCNAANFNKFLMHKGGGAELAWKMYPQMSLPSTSWG